MENKEEKKAMKTQIYNLVVLDRSGSMQSMRKAAVDGFNETLAGIKKAQERYAETQDHYISLVAFCSCSTDKIYDKVPVAEAHPMKLKDYQPCCCTPLYDAMGFAITDIQRHVKDIKDVAISVTIITDGYENASKEFTRTSIRALVESLKGQGWTFTFMGANQDAALTAETLAIRNSANFDATEDGVREAYYRDSRSKFSWFSKLNASFSQRKMMDKDDRMKMNSEMADIAFDETETEDEENYNLDV